MTVKAQVFALPGVKLPKGIKAVRVGKRRKPRQGKVRTDCRLMLDIHKDIDEIQDNATRSMMETAWQSAAAKLQLPGTEREPGDEDCLALERILEEIKSLHSSEARKVIHDALKKAAVFVLCGSGSA